VFTWDTSFQRPVDHFPNALAGKVAEASETAQALRRRRRLLMLVFLVALLPRAWSAWHWQIICTDGVSYLETADALQQGDFDTAFSYLGLNTYPVVLIWLKQSGLDRVWSGKWWSVAMATLAVLPLYGWVRRQFDDRLAVAACMLYAFHPMLTRDAPLLMRDATFWLLFNLTIYLLWRAMTEIRLWVFAASGLAMTLAIHTRSEGWFLLVPAVLWAAFRWPAAAGRRTWLAAGTAGCLAIIPLSVVLVNVTWLRECPRWQLLRPDERRDAKLLWSAVCEKLTPRRPETGGPNAAAGPAAVKKATPSSVDNRRPSNFKVTTELAVWIAKSYSYLYGLLALLGVWGWRRVYFRPDHQALLTMSVLLCAAMWIRYQYCDRYLAPVVLVSFPWIALGALLVCDWLVRGPGRFLNWVPRKRLVLGCLLLAVIAAAGLYDTAPGPVPCARQKESLGVWILQRLGANRKIVCVNSDARIAHYYAQGPGYTTYVPPRYSMARLPDILRKQSPEVILVWRNVRHPEDPYVALDVVHSNRNHTYKRVPQEYLPGGCEDVVVMVRSDIAEMCFSEKSCPVVAGKAPAICDPRR